MNTLLTGETVVRTAYSRARQEVPDVGACVALHLGGDASALAWGSGPQPDQVSALALGLDALARRYFPADRLSALAIEEAIAVVEDVVMPWHGRLPSTAQLFSSDAALVELAGWAGMPAGSAPWLLTTEAVEQLFNRWAALAQGRPASQDGLPTTAAFSMTLLVLREWLHHLSFNGITVLRSAAAAA